MAHLRLEVWALPLAQAARPLPDLAGWDVSPTDGEDGSVVLTYPENGRNADLLLALADDDVDLEVELTVTAPDGQSWVDRATLDESDVDEVDDKKIITVRGLLLGHIFREVVIPYHPTGENGETPVAGTAGLIVRQLIDAAQGRGCLTGVTLDFTDTEDSNGDPWANTGTFRLSPGQTYGAMLGTVRGYQLAEHRLGPDRVLHLYNPDGNGVDRTIGPTPLTLEYGRDLGDAPRKWRLRQAITDLVSSGKDGIYSSAGNLTARARRGRRVEGYRSFGNTADPGTLAALTQSSLNTQVNGRTEVSHKIVLGDGHPLPLIDFDTADYVFSSTRRGVTRRRVRQITLSGSDDEATSCAVTLGVLIDEWAVAQQKRLTDLESGAAVVGTSAPPPEVDDGSTPDQVVGLSVTSRWYSTGEGVGLASVLAGWTSIPDARVVGYAAEWRYTLASLGTGWRRVPTTEQAFVEWSAVNAAAAVEVRVAAVNKWDRLGPWSATVAITTEQDGTPPPVASTPAPYPALGLVIVPWNGRGSAGEVMPADFDLCEIHISTTSGFAPHRPLTPAGKLDAAASTTYAGELRAAGEWPVDVGVAGYGTTFYVKLVTRDRSNNAATASAQGSVLARAVADNEIAAMSIGKLTVGIMSAIMTVSGIIRTAASGARVELDTAGLRCISSTGAVLFEFHIPTSLLTIVGKLIAGSGIGLGATIVVDPAIAGVDFYPNATTLRTRMRARSTARPDGATAAGFEVDTINPAGQTDGFSIMAWSTNVWQGFRDTAGTFVGGQLTLERDSGLAGLSSNGSNGGKVQVTDSGQAVIGNDDGFLRVESNGDITASRAVGTSGAGFSVRAQGEPDSEGYRTYISGSNLVFVRNSNNQIVTLGGPSGAYKTFVIPHPLAAERWLVHVAVEAPEAQIEHRGIVEIHDGAAVVDLPAYFDAATVPGSGTVHLTMQLPDLPDRVLAEGAVPVVPVPPLAWAPDPDTVEVPESARVYVAAASTPVGGRFRIATPAPDGTRFAWLVKATRADGPPVDVEPLRVDVDAHGDGPYRYLTRRAGAAEGMAA